MRTARFGRAAACFAALAVMASFGFATTAIAAEPCPTIWKADNDTPPMSGWSVGESDSSGVFRWTIQREATLELPRCEGASRIRITLAYAVSESNLTDLRVTADGLPVTLTREAAREFVVAGSLPKAPLSPDHCRRHRWPMPPPNE